MIDIISAEEAKSISDCKANSERLDYLLNFIDSEIRKVAANSETELYFAWTKKENDKALLPKIRTILIDKGFIVSQLNQRIIGTWELKITW